MMKFLIERSGVPTIGLGLSAMNLEKLRQGLPIIIRGADLERPDIGDILILYGETEKQMYEEMVAAGVTAQKSYVDLDALRKSQPK